LSITSLRGARIAVDVRDGRTTVSVGVPRHGCASVGHTTLRDNAWESLRALARSLIADGIKVKFGREEATGQRRANSPESIIVAAELDAAIVAERLAGRFDAAVERVARSIATPIPRAQSVPLEEVVEEARRQEQFQLPRRFGMYEGRPPQTQESAAKMARGTTRIIERDGREGGGYVLVNVPIDWLHTSSSHVDPDRQSRQGTIGGTADPAFSTSYYGHASGMSASDAAGPCLGLENGNNRVFFARAHGRSSYPVFVVRSAWERLVREVRDARRSASDAPCETRKSSPNGRRAMKRRRRR
jgi:hypothetical protein